MRYQNELLARFKAHDAQIAIVGLGYVGFHWQWSLLNQAFLLGELI